MTTTKMRPCCARKAAKLTMDKGGLATLARKAASLEARNRDISTLKEKIEALKLVIVEDHAAIEEHEAEHAGEVD